MSGIIFRACWPAVRCSIYKSHNLGTLCVFIVIFHSDCRKFLQVVLRIHSASNLLIPLGKTLLGDVENIMSINSHQLNQSLPLLLSFPTTPFSGQGYALGANVISPFHLSAFTSLLSLSFIRVAVVVIVVVVVVFPFHFIFLLILSTALVVVVAVQLKSFLNMNNHFQFRFYSRIFLRSFRHRPSPFFFSFLFYSPFTLTSIFSVFYVSIICFPNVFGLGFFSVGGLTLNLFHLFSTSIFINVIFQDRETIR